MQTNTRTNENAKKEKELLFSSLALKNLFCAETCKSRWMEQEGSTQSTEVAYARKKLSQDNSGFSLTSQIVGHVGRASKMDLLKSIPAQEAAQSWDDPPQLMLIQLVEVSY